MPPKIPREEQMNESDDTTNAQQQLQPNPYYPTQHTRSLSEISVGEILVKYQDDNHLLNHILLAKAQEDKRRTAEELRQAEEARLQTKFIEYELTHSRGDSSNSTFDHTSSSNSSIFAAGGSSNNSNNNTTDTSFMNSNDPFADHVGHSLQAGMATTHDTSPMPMTTSEFHYIQQDNTSSISSSSPSMDFVTPSNFDLYGSNMSFSCSPPPDLPLFPPPVNQPAKEIIPPVVKSSPIATATTTTTTKGKKKSSISPKNIHRTLSYESVMTLSDLNIKQATSPPPSLPPPQPLDHDKVMEALRAKLRKSSSPYQNSRPTKPSPEPVPPPNTYPTTGVLLLNLKSRRRKSSVTKRSNSSSKP